MVHLCQVFLYLYFRAFKEAGINRVSLGLQVSTFLGLFKFHYNKSEILTLLQITMVCFIFLFVKEPIISGSEFQCVEVVWEKSQCCRRFEVSFIS